MKPMRLAMSLCCAALAVLAIAFLPGCVGQSIVGNPSPSAADGVRLSSVEASADRLTAVAVGPNGARVTIEFAKGRPRAPEWRGDPALDSATEDDLIVSDRYGQVFLTEIAGDGTVDPAWAERIRTPPTRGDIATRYEDLSLALRAADLLERTPSAAGRFAFSIRSLRNIADDTLSDDSFAPLTAQPPRPAGALPPVAPGTTTAPGVGRAAQTLASESYTHSVLIRWGSCCWGFGQHSAAQLRVTNSRNYVCSTVNSNNHGRSASDPTMATVSGCPRSFAGRSNYLPLFQPFLNQDTFSSGNAGGCGTSYGLTGGAHVCNDDSMVEYLLVRDNVTMLNACYATCADGMLRNSAPGCI